MKFINRLKLLFNRDIEEYFKKSRITYVPMVKGGMWVDHDTAMCLSAVFAAVRYVSESVATLPWELRQRRKDGGSDIALTHNVNNLIHNRPNPEMASFDWRVLMLSWANLWGNGYSEIERDSMKRPVALWPIKPDRVTAKRDANKNLYYEISQPSGKNTFLLPENMFHIRGIGSDGITGHSVVALASRSIGAGLAADEFQASFYENGVVSSGVLEHPKVLGDKGLARLKKDFKEKHAGASKAWSPMILEEGMKWQSMNMPLKDAQFLESRKFTVTEIARWFRVPPHKIADLDRATFSNIEHQSIEVVQDTIIPWAIRLEQEANYKLLGHRAQGTFYSKMNVNGMLRGDSAARAAYYKEMRSMGALNVDEIRQFEDINPIPGGAGKKYTMQSQYTTLEKIGEDPPEPVALPQLPVPTEDDEPEEPYNEKIKEAFDPVFKDAITRINNRRKNRVRDLKKNVSESEFKDALKDFIIEHNKYAEQTLDPIINGYFKALDADPDMSDKYILNFIGELK